MQYVVQIAARRAGLGNDGWSDLSAPLPTRADAEEYIAWQRRVDAAPPVVLHYFYRIVEVPDEQAPVTP